MTIPFMVTTKRCQGAQPSSFRASEKKKNEFVTKHLPFQYPKNIMTLYSDLCGFKNNKIQMFLKKFHDYFFPGVIIVTPSYLFLLFIMRKCVVFIRLEIVGNCFVLHVNRRTHIREVCHSVVVSTGQNHQSADKRTAAVQMHDAKHHHKGSHCGASPTKSMIINHINKIIIIIIIILRQLQCLTSQKKKLCIYRL